MENTKLKYKETKKISTRNQETCDLGGSVRLDSLTC